MMRRFEKKLETMRVGKVVGGTGEKRLLFENVMDVLGALVAVGKEFQVTNSILTIGNGKILTFTAQKLNRSVH